MTDRDVRTTDRSPRGKLVIAGCRSAHYLTQAVAEQLAGPGDEIAYLANIDFTFSDSEIGVRLGMDVSGCDVFLLQALYDPGIERAVSENYLALCIAARAFREWGAHKITAVLPYLAYSRQDKPTHLQREPTTARLMADLAITAGIDRLVTWHPHYPQIHGFYSGIPVDVLEANDYFLDLFAPYRGQEDVVMIAPDVGASKFVTHLGRALDLQVAIAAKYHTGREQTEVSQIIGDLADKRTALVVDDMISSGGTVDEVIRKLVDDYRIDQIVLGISHNLCTRTAYNRLRELHARYHLDQVHVTNSIPHTSDFLRLPFLQVHDLTPALVQAIKHIHHGRVSHIERDTRLNR
jgi:ribose-phosphate pyrophosphokinase